MKRVIVKSSKKYSIIIGKGLLENISDHILPILKGNNVYIITDDIVESLYISQLTKSLQKNNLVVHKYVFPNGEKSKNANNYIDILNDMAQKGISRSDTVIAFGGGVPGDLGGFVAATYLRGIKLIQIPTTLLSAVDSSVGGKTAIDLDKGKNMAGVFYQPDLVICDLSSLNTLSDETLKDGCAEVIKYGILSGDLLFNQLKKPIMKHIESIVYQCVKYKRDIVQKDEHDQYLRQLLNLGHTIGHAIELLSGYKVTHGQAVAKGISVISRISYNLSLCAKHTVDEIDNILTGYGFDLNPMYSPSDLASAIIMDKKRCNDSINLILVEDIGKCIIRKTMMNELEDMIKKAITKVPL